MSGIRIAGAISTYNRSDLFASALESLCQQSLPPEAYEIIIVDNASTDDTPQVVERMQQQFPEHTICYFNETQQGAAHARNRAFHETRAPYIAFLDDDGIAPPDWLETILRLFETHLPTPHSVGGGYIPYFTSARPAWLVDRYERRSWGDVPRLLTDGESFSGSNMAFPTELLKAYGGFPTNVGPKGRHLGVGEEYELYQRIWQGPEAPILYYNPAVAIRHHVPEFKHTPRYYLKLKFVAAQSMVKLHLAKQPLSYPRRIRRAARSFRAALCLLWRALRQRSMYTYQENWLIDAFGPVVAEIGQSLAYLGLYLRMKQR